MQEDAVELLVNGVKRVMRHMKMLGEDGRSKREDRTASSNLQSPRAEPQVLKKFEWLYTKHAGMWYPKIAAGDQVKKGEEIGHVGDFFGDVLEKITSPVDGVVLFLTINPSVIENGLLMGIGAKEVTSDK